MAQLKDLIVTGASRLIGDVYTNKIQITTLNAPIASNSATYGAGSNGQVLKTNGTSIYWSADNSTDNTKLPLAGGTMTGQIVLASTGFKTSLDHGYAVDDCGNFTHQRNTTSDWWHLNSNAGTATYKFYWETGNAEYIGNVTAPKFIGALQGNANTATTAGFATKALQDGSGNTITSRYVINTTGNNDVNTIYNTGIYNITSGSATNTPKGYGFGNLITLSYRKHQGNTTTDWASQIYLHSGNSAGTASSSYPGNVLYYRTSNASTWHDWQQVLHKPIAHTAIGGATTPVYIKEDGTPAVCTSYANATVGTAGYAVTAGSATDNTKLPLAGGTMTGAINLANNTWNRIGDDIQLGDINEAGTLGIQGINGNTSLRFTTYNQSTKTTGGKITWNGTKFVITGGVLDTAEKGINEPLIRATVDLSTLDDATWYPVTSDAIPYTGMKRAMVDVQLNSGTKPSWSTHNGGFTAIVDLLVTAGGWGTTSAYTILLQKNFLWVTTDANPVGYQQLTNSSRICFWLRGGGKYYLATDFSTNWTINTTSVTFSSQTIEPTTTYPGINYTAKGTIGANLDGNANTASTAGYATTASQATHAATANSATTASQATHAATANSATTATYAISAGSATDNTKLPLAGGQMTGPITWKDNTALPEFSGAPTYLLGIEAFASGGTTKWKSATAVKVGSATTADQATHAATANSATTASQATHAATANSATTATEATHAATANSATTATNATQAGKLSHTPNNTTTFLRGDNTWSNELATSVGASTPILKLSTSASIASSYAWGMTHTVSNLGAGANSIGVMTGQAMNTGNAGYLGFQWAGSNNNNNFVSLGLYGNDHLLKVYKTGNVSIGNSNNSYKLDVTGTTRISGPVLIGAGDTTASNGYAVNNSGTNNYIAFYGVNGDNPGSYNHAYIGESIYGPKGTVNEQSELLLFKGNDIGTANPGPDRIRLFAHQVDIQAYTAATYGTWDTIRATTGTQIAKFRAGEVTITGNLNPEADNTRSLGVSGTRWANAYITTVHGSLDGNANTAAKLQTARTISLTGSVTGSGSFDGSGNLSISTTTNHDHTSINGIKVYTNSAAAGKTYINWIKFASIDIGTNNYWGDKIYDIYLHRSYNSPSSEVYAIRVCVGWGSSNIIQLGGKYGTQIITKFRIVRDNTNHIAYLEYYVNPSYTTYQNVVNIKVVAYHGATVTLINEIQTEADSVFTGIEEINLTNGIVGNLTGTATESIHATTANSATTANEATHAATANSATTASQATHAATANSATTASEATHAATANTASTAGYATTASQATHAATANTAATAGYATTASQATHATTANSATTATEATHAATANTASTAGFATTASQATHAATANSATTATEATHAATANSATTATNATQAGKLTTARSIGLSGDVTGSNTFDGSANTTIAATVVKVGSRGRRTTAEQIAVNPSVTDGCSKMTWHLTDSSSRTADATNSPSFDGAIINLPWDWGAYNGQIALANTNKDAPRMQIRAATSIDNGTTATPRYTPSYGAWREVITSPKATTVGSATQPVYVNATGQVVACTSYANATVGTAGYATTASQTTHAATANTATTSTYATNSNTSKYLWTGNQAPIYGSSFLEYFNASTTAGNVANATDSPTTNWYHHLRMNHGNSGGYYFDIASSFHDNNMYFKRVANGSSSGWKHIWVEGNAVTGAVWNDYAEYRQSKDIDYGYIIQEVGDDTLQKTSQRLDHFAGVVSDTWGFAQGKTENAKTPIAVAGRVLVYPGEDRNKYKPGDCVCAGPDGKAYIMTREEIIKWPDRIVGTVSCVPDYNEWGGGKDADRPSVKVNGRIWIKVK